MIEVLEAPTIVEPTTPIKPSQAIKLGRLTRPIQTPRHMFIGDDGACAFGALYIGVVGEWKGEDIPGDADRERVGIAAANVRRCRWLTWRNSLPPKVDRYIDSIPVRFDFAGGERTIIEELEAMGY